MITRSANNCDGDIITNNSCNDRIVSVKSSSIIIIQYWLLNTALLYSIKLHFYYNSILVWLQIISTSDYCWWWCTYWSSKNSILFSLFRSALSAFSTTKPLNLSVLRCLFLTCEAIWSALSFAYDVRWVLMICFTPWYFMYTVLSVKDPVNYEQSINFLLPCNFLKSRVRQEI